MPMKRCDNGHYYDLAKHTSCPYCGIKGVSPGDTVRPPQPAQGDAKDPLPTQAYGAPRKTTFNQGETVRLPKKQMGIDPVVGWLVCTAGPERGRDYRIKMERNFIGRSPSMDIYIESDEAVSREKHAILSFNPKNRRFTLAPGESRGIIYRNSEEVIQAVELAPYDTIEMGSSTFMFIPLCNERFQWNEDPQQP